MDDNQVNRNAEDNNGFRNEQQNEQDDFEKPKFISLDKYNNYKYQSLYLNYILKDKEIFNDKFTKEYVNSLVILYY